MRITHLRNATIIIHVGPYNILVDPMLAPKDLLPPLRLLVRQRLRNPTVELPANADAVLESVTHCLITHCQKGHFDHLDRAGKRWLRERQIPVVCTSRDVEYLRKRGLNALPLHAGHAEPQLFLDGTIRTVRCTHGLGLVGAVMEHGVGYFIEMPGEPSLYLSGDTVLTDNIRQFVQRYQPEVCVVPAGGAHFDLGGDIIMGADEVIELVRIAKGRVVANHMGALSHCPVQREDLRRTAHEAGLGERLCIPQDGETITFEREGTLRGSKRVVPQRGEKMLQMRPNCECCDKDLPPGSAEARICSFECTFCTDCAAGALKNKCPKCGGELVARPRRPLGNLVIETLQ